MSEINLALIGCGGLGSVHAGCVAGNERALVRSDGGIQATRMVLAADRAIRAGQVQEL